MSNEGFVMLTEEEQRIWELIKKYPDELGFVLQERDYAAYVDTFCMSDHVVLSEEEFYLIKNYFKKEHQDEDRD